jgi:hypothetical protein
MGKTDKTLISAKIDSGVYEEFKIRAIQKKKFMAELLQELMEREIN